MESNAIFQVEVLNLLNKLKAKKEAIQRDFEQKIAEVDREIDAVTVTSRLLRDQFASSAPLSEVPANVSVAELAGKSARQALIGIARRNDGIVNVSIAKRLLVAAGIVKEGKNAWGAVYTTLSRSREFEKVQSGVFRLIEPGTNKALPLRMPLLGGKEDSSVDSTDEAIFGLPPRGRIAS